MSETTVQRPWLSLALSVFFAVVGVMHLVGPEPDPETAVWELSFALANGLFYWIAKGAPAWVRPVAFLVFFGGLFVAVRDLFF